MVCQDTLSRGFFIKTLTQAADDVLELGRIRICNRPLTGCEEMYGRRYLGTRTAQVELVLLRPVAVSIIPFGGLSYPHSTTRSVGLSFKPQGSSGEESEGGILTMFLQYLPIAGIESLPTSALR